MRRPLIALAPWRRAPLLLARSPGVLGAVAGAGFLLTLAVASRPVFLASAGAAAVDSDIRDGCRYDIGLRITSGRTPRTAIPDRANVARIPDRTRLIDGAVKGQPVQPTIVTVAGGTAELTTPQGERGQGVVQLFARTGATDHVNVMQRAANPAATANDPNGVWLPDTTAALLQAKPGDTVTAQLGNDRTAVLPVAGVFEDLTYVERPAFWCAMQRTFEPLGANPLPPVALLEQQALLDLLAQGDRVPNTVSWEVPPKDGLSVPRAEKLVDHLDSLQHDPAFAERFGADDGVITHFALPATVEHAHTVAGQVRTTADTVGAASTAIALVAVAAAGFFWVDRRRGEVALLLAKGVSPGGLAFKAALESTLPLVLGGAVGIAAAVAAVRRFGPNPAFDGPATASAVRLAAIAAFAGLALLAVAAGIRSSRAEQRMAGLPHGRRHLAPIGLATLAAGAIASALAIERGTDAAQISAGEDLGLIVVVFPLLVLAGGGGLIAVLGHLLLPRTRALGRKWPIAPYLALRRVATAGPLALALTAGSVLSVGILLYASVVADSARATVTAKASIGVGSDMAAFLTTQEVPPLPADIARRSTPVLRSSGEVEGVQVDVLGIDRDTFARGAFYDRSFGGRSLAALLKELDRSSATEVAVIAADAAGVPDRFTVDAGGAVFTARVVARVRAFPGMSGENTMVVADESALRQFLVRGNRQLWIRGATGSVAAQLDRAHIPVVTTTEAKANQAASSLLPLATSLGYFQALGLLGGTVTLTGAVFYLASRERARRLAGVMARGMGLSRNAARAALALEVGTLLVLGLLLGGALSAWAARTTFPHLDPSPGTPPPLIFRWDPAALAWTALVTAAATAALTLLSERATSRRLAAEVVRADA